MKESNDKSRSDLHEITNMEKMRPQVIGCCVKIADIERLRLTNHGDQCRITVVT